MTLLKKLDKALEGMTIADTDGATVELARQFAKAIDAGEGDIDRVGSRMLATLVELQMTPKSRNQVAKNDGPTINPVDELRAKRSARASGT